MKDTTNVIWCTPRCLMFVHKDVHKDDTNVHKDTTQ